MTKIDVFVFFIAAIIDQMRTKLSPVKSTSVVNDDEEEKKWRRYVDNHVKNI